jgi:hypothetical protein
MQTIDAYTGKSCKLCGTNLTTTDMSYGICPCCGSLLNTHTQPVPLQEFVNSAFSGPWNIEEVVEDEAVQKGKKVNDLRKFLGKKNRKNKY